MIYPLFNGYTVGQRFARAFGLIVVGYRDLRPIYAVAMEEGKKA